jgi:hypothetical protein
VTAKEPANLIARHRAQAFQRLDDLDAIGKVQLGWPKSRIIGQANTTMHMLDKYVESKNLRFVRLDNGPLRLAEWKLVECPKKVIDTSSFTR